MTKANMTVYKVLLQSELMRRKRFFSQMKLRLLFFFENIESKTSANLTFKRVNMVL